MSTIVVNHTNHTKHTPALRRLMVPISVAALTLLFQLPHWLWWYLWHGQQHHLHWRFIEQRPCDWHFRTNRTCALLAVKNPHTSNSQLLHLLVLLLRPDTALPCCTKWDNHHVPLLGLRQCYTRHRHAVCTPPFIFRAVVEQLVLRFG